MNVFAPSGWKHRENFKAYYQTFFPQWMLEQQTLQIQIQQVQLQQFQEFQRQQLLATGQVPLPTFALQTDGAPAQPLPPGVPPPMFRAPPMGAPLPPPPATMV